MSKIIATYNFENHNWEFSFQNLAPAYADLFIGFISNSSVVEFENLSFKYELKQQSNIKQYGVFPRPGVKYVRTDQPFLVSERLSLQTQTEYDVYIWAENGGEAFDGRITFTTPLPKQPHSSWIWDGENWEAPVAMPEDGKEYRWSEYDLDWVEIPEEEV